MTRTASDAMVERLMEWGVDTVFGLPGDGINGFWEALRKKHGRIRYIHVRHEEVGAMAAVGYAKFTGKLGVCVATSGPGAIHLANGLLDARLEQAPVLAITGMAYHDLIGTNFLQDTNNDYFLNDVTVFNQRIMGPAHIANMVDHACRTALGQRGPAHLGFPIDFQSMDAEDERRSPGNIEGHSTVGFWQPVRVPRQDEMGEAARLFAGKSRIAILAGAGARGAGEELEEVAEKLGAPIIKAMLGKDCVSDDSPYTTGGVGPAGTLPSYTALKQCEALLIVGSTQPYLPFYPAPGQAVCAQIDDKPERIGLRHPVNVGLAGDAKATLRELLPLLERNEDRSFLELSQEGMESWWTLMEERGTREDVPMKPQVPAWNLTPLLADDAIVCGDSGTVTFWANRQIKLRRGQNFSFSGTNCSMAAGLPYAIGAQVAYPERQVVVFTGDGSLTMHLGDFLTCVQHDLPVKIIVLKNNTLGLIKWEQMIYLGNPEYGNDMAPLDFAKYAEACGVRGMRIEDPTRCREQLEEALSWDGPAIIEAVVDPEEPIISAPLNPQHAENYFTALRRGTENRERIAETIVQALQEEQSLTPNAINERSTQLIEQLQTGEYRNSEQEEE